jgi:diguanylate cyclase (GGDEF)-like protein
VTLRTRLTIAFLAVVLGPVLLGAVFVGGTVATVGRDRSLHELDLAASAVRSSVATLCQQLRTAAEVVALQPSQQRARFAAELAGRDPVTAIEVIDPDGRLMMLTDDPPVRPWADCAGPTGGPIGGAGHYWAIGAHVALPGGDGEVWAVARLDRPFVERLAAAAGVAVTLIGTDPTEPVLSTDRRVDASLETVRHLGAGASAQSPQGQWVRRLDPTEGQPLSLVLAAPQGSRQGLYALVTALVVATGLLAVVAAWRLARSTTEPLAELSRAADRVAQGDLTVRVPVRGNDEAGRLAATFNRMTHQTQAYVQALTASRDQLRRHLTVLGDTLSSTHDLERILRVILRTAVAATGARAGSVLLLDQETGALTGHAADSSVPGEADEEPVTVPLGEGLLGAAAATGEPLRGQVTSDGPALHEAEPGCRTYLVVPISAPGGMPVHAAPWPAPPTVRGVLALYDRLGGDEFDDTDLLTLRTFAGQAAVAVDNVRIHEEAQRLSLTDPLTGLWNYRSLKESLRREVERASRFGHTLAVLALDLDRFKDINDAHGHPAGDAVLADFARRIRSAIREVDLAFRQGGEEFVVLLPETDARGAAVLAERLGTEVRGEPVTIPGRGAGTGPSIQITVSIGIAVYPDHALTPQALLDAGDDALYAAKAAGRDTYRVATVAPEPVAAAELSVRAGARIPHDNLPRAGGSADGSDGSGGSADVPGGSADGPGGSAVARGGSADRRGGAQPPRQTRGR